MGAMGGEEKMILYDLIPANTSNSIDGDGDFVLFPFFHHSDIFSGLSVSRQSLLL